MSTGIVKWFNDDKGYGFIIPDEGEMDLFVHYSGIAEEFGRSLPEGVRVYYEVGSDAKGPVALNVRMFDYP